MFDQLTDDHEEENNTDNKNRESCKGEDSEEMDDRGEDGFSNNDLHEYRQRI